MQGFQQVSIGPYLEDQHLAEAHGTILAARKLALALIGLTLFTMPDPSFYRTTYALAACKQWVVRQLLGYCALEQPCIAGVIVARFDSVQLQTLLVDG